MRKNLAARADLVLIRLLRRLGSGLWAAELDQAEYLTLAFLNKPVPPRLAIAIAGHLAAHLEARDA